jgi:hypothetical protein
MTYRFERDIKRTLETSFDCTVMFERGKTHNFVIIRRVGWSEIRLPISVSPKNEGTALREVVRDVRRRIQEGLTQRL